MEPTPTAPLPPIIPEIQPIKSHKKMWVMGIIGLIVLCLAGAGYYWFQTKVPKQKDDTVAVAPSAPQSENPMTAFQQRFALLNYQVNITNEAGNLIHTFYYERGQLVRVDARELTNNNTIIIKNNKLYDLDTINKTFLELSLSDGQALAALFYYKKVGVIDLLLQSETPPSTPWSRITDNPRTDVVGYQTSGRKLLIDLSRGEEGADVKILVSPATGLIAQAAYKLEKSGGWTTLNFDYKTLTDLDSLKRFPAEYQKIER